MEYIIDRWEGAFAVCEREDGVMVEIPRALLPEGCVEGAKLVPCETGYCLKDNTEDRVRLRRQMDRLFGRKKQPKEPD